MFIVLLPDGSVITHPKGAIRARPGECPEHDTKTEGFCVVLSDLEAVTCLGAYPTGSTWHDCVSEEPDCPGVTELQQAYTERSAAGLAERRQQLIARAHAATQKQKREKDEKDQGRRAD